MPMTSSSLLTALERAVPGGIFPEIFERTAMAGDASHYALTPTVVVRPETAAEVGQLFRISHDEEIGIWHDAEHRRSPVPNQGRHDPHGEKIF